MKNLLNYEGGHLSYDIFIGFVRDILGPHMQMEFQEEEYYYEIWKDYYERQYTVTEIARGHSKSEFGIWVTIYDAVFKPENQFSGKRIQQQLVISADRITVNELNQRISSLFFDVPELEQFLPIGVKKKEQKTPRWNSDTIELRNKAIIHFRSVKTKRGLHVDRIWMDDPTTESSTLSDTETYDFVTGAILPMGTVKEAIVNFTGTPLRVTDILTVMGGKPAFEHKKMPAIDEHGNLLSPKRFSQKALDNILSTIGSTKFTCEYLLNPIDDSVSLIKRVWVESCFDYEYNLTYEDFDVIYLGVDFAFSDRITADKSAFIDVGIKDGKKHLLNYRTERGLSVREQLEIVGLMHATKNYEYIALEENSIKSVSKDIKEMDLPIKLYWMGNRDERDKRKPTPDFEGKTNSISKINAINRLGVSLENGDWVIPYNTKKQKQQADLIRDELVSWALEEGKLVEIGRHPDGPIGMILCLELEDEDEMVVV